MFCTSFCSFICIFKCLGIWFLWTSVLVYIFSSFPLPQVCFSALNKEFRLNNVGLHLHISPPAQYGCADIVRLCATLKAVVRSNWPEGATWFEPLTSQPCAVNKWIDTLTLFHLCIDFSSTVVTSLHFGRTLAVTRTQEMNEWTRAKGPSSNCDNIPVLSSALLYQIKQPVICPRHVISFFQTLTNNPIIHGCGPNIPLPPTLCCRFKLRLLEVTWIPPLPPPSPPAEISQALMADPSPKCWIQVGNQRTTPCLTKVPEPCGQNSASV